ncbi:MFS transporter [Streptomyces sp. AF1A]|uniref:MFS transporter n=1 Tax=Streptomyces sp. AF1A TaxID=3394350 RepID=UPI0039BD054D
MKSRTGRVYRVGESDVDLMGRGRVRMAVLPCVGMAGIGSTAYAAVAAQHELRAAHQWGADTYWPMAVWALLQTAVALPAGRLRDTGRLTARTAVLLGASATLLGYLALAWAPDLRLACLGFAVFAGLGCGVVHATCLALPVRWFPERRGGWTALVEGGYVLGVVPFALLLGPDPGAGRHRFALTAVGAGLCLAVAAAGRYFRDPPDNWWPPHVDPLRGPAAPAARRVLEKNPPAVRQFGLREAARTPALWVMGCCLLGTSGITVFGPLSLAAPGSGLRVSDRTVTAAVVLAAVVGGAGLGLVGLLSDRVGRRTALIAACLVLGTAQFGTAAAAQAGGGPLFLGCAVAVGLGGGAVLPLVAALAADCFGENRIASVYGLLSASRGVAVLAGLGTSPAVFGARYGHGAFVLAGCTGLACAVLALFLKAPGRPSARRIVPNPHPLGEEMV